MKRLLIIVVVVLVVIMGFVALRGPSPEKQPPVLQGNSPPTVQAIEKPSPPEQPRKVVAIVNGVSLHEDEIFNLKALAEYDEPQRPHFVQAYVTRAIDMELLIQEARKHNIPETREYKKLARRYSSMRTHRQTEGIVRLYESRNQELVDFKNPELVPQSLVDPIVQERSTADMPLENIEAHVRLQLAKERHAIAYGQWVLAHLLQYPIAINGRRIDEDSIRTAVDRNMGPVRPPADRLSPLWRFVIEAAGFDPAVVTRDLNVEQMQKLRTAIIDSELSVGETVYSLREMALFSLLQEARVAYYMINRPQGPFLMLKKYALLESAVRDGVGSSAADEAEVDSYVRYGPSGDTQPARDVSNEQQILIGAFLKWYAKIDQMEFDDATIQAYYEENKGRMPADLTEVERRIDIEFKLRVAKTKAVRIVLMRELHERASIETPAN
jgi:hypothetical protein